MIILDTKSSYGYSQGYNFYNEDKFCGKFDILLETDCVSIWGVMIFPEFREKKLANQMMIECVEIIKEIYSQYNRAILFVDIKNIRAIKAYEFAGFSFVTEKNPIPVRKMEINYARKTI